MLFLNKEEIFRSVKLEEVVDVIEESMKLYETGKFEMPTRMHVDYDGNTLLLMPCYAENRVGTKLLTLTPDNKERELPVIQGCFILNDAETGEILAFIEGSSLTALRTGAVGSVSIRNMTSKDISSVGIVGAGVQGYHQALFASKVRAIDTIYVHDINDKRVREFKEKFSESKDPNIIYVDYVKELVQRSDVVITATTANEPVLPDESKIFKGKHFVGIGSYKPNMREYPKAIYEKIDKIIIDTEDAVDESGDITLPLENGWIGEDQIQTMGKLLNGEIDLNLNKTTFFKTVGMALFDLVTANLVYKKAEELDFGIEIDF
ncbi:MAG: ornithine cyclodeaminase family protein [Thermoplasmatota archaeon]